MCRQGCSWCVESRQGMLKRSQAYRSDVTSCLATAEAASLMCRAHHAGSSAWTSKGGADTDLPVSKGGQGERRSLGSSQGSESPGLGPALSLLYPAPQVQALQAPSITEGRGLGSHNSIHPASFPASKCQWRLLPAAL